MNCTSEIKHVSGLRPRRPIGLRRPTKVHPVLGTIELVREERCHSWQCSHQFVRSRVIVIDGILQESEEIQAAESFLEALATQERQIREKAIRARYFEFIGEGLRSLAFKRILENLDDWMAPYRVDRCGGRTTVEYDCFDAPNEALLGAPQIRVSLHEDWSISQVNYFAIGVADFLRIEAYRRRAIPDGCGFVADSIADQFIVSDVWVSAELAPLLDQSIEQTAALLERPVPGSEPFLRCAYSLLRNLRDTRLSVTPTESR